MPEEFFCSESPGFISLLREPNYFNSLRDMIDERRGGPRHSIVDQALCACAEASLSSRRSEGSSISNAMPGRKVQRTAFQLSNGKMRPETIAETQRE
jgi:hypothetical protein